MNIILIGPPGAGKGTQADYLVKEFELVQLSTGDMCRAAMKENSDLGNLVRSIVDSGDLVPDEIMIEMISNRIEKADCKKGFILDGFPRNVPQAKALQSMLNDKDFNIDHVIEFSVNSDILLERIRNRISQTPPDQRRKDDNEDTLKYRLKVYEEQTEPLVPFYSDQGILTKIDGMLPVDVVSTKLESILKG